MKFICSGDHFYKVFIESILDMNPTYLVQDYLNRIQHIYFDKDVIESPTSEITIQTDDITALKDIVSEKELNKIMMHRFVDGLKKMIEIGLHKDDTHAKYKLHIRLGEYREHLLSYVQNINKKVSPELKLMEEILGNDFKKDRNEATAVICRQLVDEELNSQNPLDLEKNVQGPNLEDSLEFLTHNRNINSHYKEQKDSWETYKTKFNCYFSDLKDDDLSQQIKHLHTLLISSRIPGASTFKEIQGIIEIDTDSTSFRKDSFQGYLKSNLWKTSKNGNYAGILNNYGHNKNSYGPSSKYSVKLESRIQTLYNTLRQHLDNVPKNSFNINETLRLLFHVEMHVLMKLNIRQGSLKKQEQNLITNYTKMIDESQDYLVYYSQGNDSELYSLMKKFVFNDLFGRTKIDSANIFSTTITKMEEILASILNNSNYNFASFNMIKLLEKFITAFDEFLEENEKFNRYINDSHSNTTTDLPDLNKFKMDFDKLEKHNSSYTEFTKEFNIDFQKENLILNVFNETNVFDKKEN